MGFLDGDKDLLESTILEKTKLNLRRNSRTCQELSQLFRITTKFRIVQCKILNPKKTQQPDKRGRCKQHHTDRGIFPDFIDQWYTYNPIRNIYDGAFLQSQHGDKMIIVNPLKRLLFGHPLFIPTSLLNYFQLFFQPPTPAVENIRLQTTSLLK